ncbi:hypothetical protein [Kineosporia sp. NBRC 101731]|uniref:hypothetical protein n=1 Tax=Kineosporia sp. NBRC 101731 TaxID=3032199 RepID=UPI0024A1A440|nr:hypothetical protein [Kineosporia sp. NBRC 101731]GLY32072.1 hypothetical protein Kisp02_54370 [Kineosporia sp. NBRC 101731]
MNLNDLHPLAIACAEIRHEAEVSDTTGSRQAWDDAVSVLGQDIAARQVTAARGWI